jgi:hypothetical protein
MSDEMRDNHGLVVASKASTETSLTTIMGLRSSVMNGLRVNSVSRTVNGGDESALAVDVVLDGTSGAIRFHQTVLALGLVTITVLVVVLDVVGVGVLHAI